MSEVVALWIIAICALIWTVRMMFTGLLLWLAARYRYTTPPAPVRWLGRMLSGGRR